MFCFVMLVCFTPSVACSASDLPYYRYLRKCRRQEAESLEDCSKIFLLLVICLSRTFPSILLLLGCIVRIVPWHNQAYYLLDQSLNGRNRL
ncbi:hypothetical protein BDW72DRAFT_186285 [Aspergillus terricola var. indicus]